ncbi:hypothetical protein ACFOEW_00275 [Alteromonas oceani]|uniref:Colanic acid biosynthesis acetyltransferase n=1 Tax=Alteromonas oceani TaxID=2071609 RepID=A0ABV7JVT7_9ALTE|nr:putative colanic acid biosynthesis acetyltransferase [Alteromonas oceani]
MSEPLDASTTKPFEGGASFSLKHRLVRVLWEVCWFLLARWTPVPFHAWRARLLRFFGAKIEQGVFIYPSVKIWYPPNLIMEAKSTLGPEVQCYCMARIHLKEESIVSQRATLCAGTHDIDDPEFQLQTKPITIGKHAWIAAEAFVGPGVFIDDGAVLGARGVTFKNLDRLQVYTGNPAKKMRSRSELIIKNLMH